MADMREYITSQRQLTMQRLADEEKRAIRSADWLQLAKDFESCPRDVRADYSRCGLPGRDEWWIGGMPHPDKCRSLCKLAGTMLLRSRKVFLGLSEDLRSVSDPTYRWLYFLKARKPLENYLFAVETFPDGRTAGVYSGIINNLPEVSAAACVECAATEM